MFTLEKVIYLFIFLRKSLNPYLEVLLESDPQTGPQIELGINDNPEQQSPLKSTAFI